MMERLRLRVERWWKGPRKAVIHYEWRVPEFRDGYYVTLFDRQGKAIRVMGPFRYYAQAEIRRNLVTMD